MDKATDQQRRQFLKNSGMLGGSLVLGLQLTACDSPQSNRATIRKLTQAHAGTDMDASFIPNAFLRINTDNSIVIHLPCSEMGQGVATSLTMLVAEELEADWDSIRIEFAPAHEAYENPRSGRQVTGGSASIRGFWEPMRRAGMMAREMLITAAARTWKTSPSQCMASDGKVIHKPDGKLLAYGKLVKSAQDLETPTELPALKTPDQYKLIGQPVSRIDSHDKVTGKAVFGQDVQLPGMLVANVVRCPVFEGRLKRFDSARAMRIPGIIDIFAIDTKAGSGVAIVAKNFWATQQARKALSVEWDEGEYAGLDSRQIRQQFIHALPDGKEIESRGDTQLAFAASSSMVEAIYETPFLAHACMEPMNCTAHVQDQRCDIWVSTQGQGPAQKAAAKITGLSRDQVYVHTTYLGGGFGRRGETDFVQDAVMISHRLKKPVKVIWTREDDIQHDYYRPANYNRITAALDTSGMPVAWEHNIAGPSILHRVVPFAGIVLRGKDATSTEGADNLPYDIPDFKVTYAMVNPGIPVGFWRSVGNSQTAYVTECFLDELAAKHAKDPYELRMALLKQHPRHRTVLQRAASAASWGKTLPDGHYHGIAVMECFDSFLAYVAEISIEGSKPDARLRVHRMTAAVDCGTVINPDTVTAQIEGGIVFGLTAALYGDITIDRGRVRQGNFDDYPMLRIDEMPHIDVHLVKSNEYPGGVGETGVPLTAPAVANAVFAATGKPVRKLPINVNELI